MPFNSRILTIFSSEESAIVPDEKPFSLDEGTEGVVFPEEENPTPDSKAFAVHRFPTQQTKEAPGTEMPKGPIPFDMYNPAQLAELRKEYPFQSI